MDKPTPKTEIVIGYKGKASNGGLLHIFVASPDAYRWIEKESASFGTLFLPDSETNHFTLFVAPVYDTDEVEAYLLSYLESDKGIAP